MSLPVAPTTMLRWPAEELWEALQPLCPGLSVEVATEVDSTSSRLLERARAGDASPCLLVAERQTAGRGRLGRSWEASPGASLTFSLALPLAPRAWSGLSLVAGVALAEALHERVRLKWPNDLWLVDGAGQGRKLGGILIETAQAAGGPRVAVVGVGLNIRQEAIAGETTSRASLDELESGAQAPATLLRIAAPLLRVLQAFEREGFAPWMARYAARDALAGRSIRLLQHQGGSSEGQALGVDEQGALLVQTAAGLQTITSAEVSVRPC
ncbi:MAG TPA: biotin--[acetyl-CoA-carboxylase] ligase [Methylibium sp.]